LRRKFQTPAQKNKFPAQRILNACAGKKMVAQENYKHCAEKQQY
jgi:hypothetical protein